MRGKRMSKTRKKEVLVDAKEAYKQKKVRAPKNNSKGPEKPQVKANAKIAAKSKLSKSEASKAVWKNPEFRKKITEAIKRSCAARKAAAAKTKPKAKVTAQAQVQA
jgi:hypothetical protein